LNLANGPNQPTPMQHKGRDESPTVGTTVCLEPNIKAAGVAKTNEHRYAFDLSANFPQICYVTRTSTMEVMTGRSSAGIILPSKNLNPVIQAVT
jgi:hypothetical protein